MTAEADPGMREPARIAVIGAGPAGLYTVLALVESESAVSVDVFDRLPTPYGLVRYGVAPDQVKMKSVTRVMQTPFTGHDVEFFGNVVVGSDITHEELREHYHAVVYATGSPNDRKLDIPGEELEECQGAASFVNWYSGHPDVADADFTLEHPEVAVVGAGNVALDVARVLAKSPDEMAETDVPDNVMYRLRDSRVNDIHVLIRRGPSQVKFTPPELRLIGQLANADVIVHHHGLTAEPSDDDPQDKRARKNIELLREWSQREPTGKPRRVHLRFFRSPVEVLGTDQVEGVVLERNQLTESGGLEGSGEYETLNVGLVLSAVGYQGVPLPGLPFDSTSGTVPQHNGRICEGDEPLTGVYVSGWAKRGPSGVIGTNKSDGAETAGSVLEDLPKLPAPARVDRAAVQKLLARRGARVVDWQGWVRLDAYEAELGASQGRNRAKLADLETMLTVIDNTAPPAG